MRPSRLNAWRDALTEFVESREGRITMLLMPGRVTWSASSSASAVSSRSSSTSSTVISTLR
jgi:hypothetical protein